MAVSAPSLIYVESTESMINTKRGLGMFNIYGCACMPSSPAFASMLHLVSVIFGTTIPTPFNI